MTTIASLVSEYNKRCNEVIKAITIFLNKLPSLKDSQTEYERRIQQDAEYLLDIPNYGLLDDKVYKNVYLLFTRVVDLKETYPNLSLINSLYDILKYVLNWILTIIENEILIK